VHRLHQDRRGIRIKESSAPFGCAAFLLLERIFRRSGGWKCFALRGDLLCPCRQSRQNATGVWLDVIWRKRPHHIHPAPRTPEKTARLRKKFLASGAILTGLCQRRLGCRPAQFNRSILLPNKAPAALRLSFPLRSPIGTRPFAPICPPQPGTVKGPLNITG